MSVYYCLWTILPFSIGVLAIFPHARIKCWEERKINPKSTCTCNLQTIKLLVETLEQHWVFKKVTKINK